MVKNNKGFTLVELLVAVSIFAILSIIISGIYLSFSKSQARTKASLTLLNDSQYILETIANEIKNNEIHGFGVNLDCSDICVLTLKKENGDYIVFLYVNPSDILYYSKPSFAYIPLNNINDFKITYFDLILSDDLLQPRVTIVMHTENVTDNENERVSYKLQTTVSSRIYK